MTCRQAFELDLPAFLANSREARFADFVDHYPRCPECSAEIRAWTELDETLRRTASAPASAHPEPELLVRFDEEPAGLGESQRTSIEAHLAGCIACRDELAALRTFVQDGPPAANLASGVAPAPRPSGLALILAGLRGIVWQPAFAYALLALALVPTIYRSVDPSSTLRPEGLQPIEQRERVALRETAQKYPAARSLVPFAADNEAYAIPFATPKIADLARVDDGAQPGIKVPRPLQAKRKRPPPDEQLARALAITLIDERRISELEDTRVADAAGGRTFEPYDAKVFDPLADDALASEDFGRLQAPGSLEPSKEADLHAAAGAIASTAASELSKPSSPANAPAPTSKREFEELGESDFAAAASQYSSAAPNKAAIREKTARDRTLAQRSLQATMAFAPTRADLADLSLDPDTRRHAPPEVLATGLLLHIPLARPAPEPRLVEVRIFAPDGERELVERHHLVANRASLDSRLPAAWLTPGEYRVLVVVENEEPAEYHFSIRAPDGD